jgi:hypothetical protein
MHSYIYIYIYVFCIDRYSNRIRSYHLFVWLRQYNIIPIPLNTIEMGKHKRCAYMIVVDPESIILCVITRCMYNNVQNRAWAYICIGFVDPPKRKTINRSGNWSPINCKHDGRYIIIDVYTPLTCSETELQHTKLVRSDDYNNSELGDDDNYYWYWMQWWWRGWCY